MDRVATTQAPLQSHRMRAVTAVAQVTQRRQSPALSDMEDPRKDGVQAISPVAGTDHEITRKQAEGATASHAVEETGVTRWPRPFTPHGCW
jgi:hypothetical protein